MMCNVPMLVALNQVLNHLDDEEPAPGCHARASAYNRGFCGGRYPYKQRQSDRVSPPSPPRTQQADVRELDDSYVLFVDVPGCGKEDVNVQVDEGHLFVSATKKQSPDDPSTSRSLVSERPRGGVRRSWRLPQDAMLDGIHAKLNNGELLIAIPKRVPRSFQVPVLGADQDVKTALPAPAQPAAVSAATVAAPVTDAAAPAAVPDEATTEGAAIQSAVPSPAMSVEAPSQDAAMTDAEERDGSWVDVSDEEREAEAAERRAKGKYLMEGPVLEEIERQEAEMRAAAADCDSD